MDVGSLLLGVYLLVSLNLFGMHRNDAFSSLRIQDWKGFLRFTIEPDGRLRMRFIGFEKVPRKWETAVIGGGKILRPAREEHLVGEVIDEIDIPGGRSKASAEAAPRDAEAARHPESSVRICRGLRTWTDVARACCSDRVAGCNGSDDEAAAGRLQVSRRFETDSSVHALRSPRSPRTIPGGAG
jgi:hypothetical protein